MNGLRDPIHENGPGLLQLGHRRATGLFHVGVPNENVVANESKEQVA
jgi:hypothetical protein